MKNYAGMFVTTAMAVLMLSGCSQSKYINVDVNGAEVKVKSFELSAAMPDGWEIFRGEDMYKTIYETVSDYYKSADEMREANEESGLQYVLFSREKEGETGECSSVIVKTQLLSSLGDYTAADYSRELHDSGVIGYQSGGCTISDSSYEEREIGGKQGWLSRYSVYSGEQLVLGQITYVYPHDDRVVMITGTFLTEEERDGIESAVTSIGSTE